VDGATVRSHFGREGNRLYLLEPMVVGEDFVPEFSYHPGDENTGSMAGFEAGLEKTKDGRNERVHSWMLQIPRNSDGEIPVVCTQVAPLLGQRSEDGIKSDLIEPWESQSTAMRWPRRSRKLVEYQQRMLRVRKFQQGEL
jgi:hypothetical protein